MAQPVGALPAGKALLAYGATIVSFLGAIHWGLVMREASVPSQLSLLWGVVPSLLAWVALLLQETQGLVAIALLLWACLAVDRVLYPRHRLRAWLPMRLWLTLVASGSCLVAAVALSRSAS